MFDIPFAISAHWPGIQQDPTWINENFAQDNGDEIMVNLEVIDPQDNVERVWLDTSDFNGGETDLLYLGSQQWGCVFSQGFAYSGNHTVLVSAKSVGSDVLLHNYVDILVENNYGAKIEGRVFNAITTEPASGTLLTLTNADALGYSPDPLEIPPTGEYIFSIPAGDYSMTVESHNSLVMFDTMSTIQDVHLNSASQVIVDFGLGPASLNNLTEQICCINGQVFDVADGEPVEGAFVSISGKSQTGGTFENRITDENGHFVFWKVNCKGIDNLPIEELEIKCVTDGYGLCSIDPVPYGWNKNTPQQDFHLSEVVRDPVWDGEDDDGWSYAGDDCANMWHTHYDSELYNASAYMPASDGGTIVILPPDDTTGGRVWQPWTGNSALWYGEEDDGSFIHDWANNAPGGFSICAHEGNATTPFIDLTGLYNVKLSWKQIWEIEGVDPSICYDGMKVYIQDVAGGGWFLIEHSNPLAEPIPDLGGLNAKHPYTSGGFNIAPVWQGIFFGLADMDNLDTPEIEHANFTDKIIQLKFHFKTWDPLYNGFRGWLIDDIKIEEG